MTEQLTDLVRHGSIRAFEALYRQHRDRALRFALYFTRSPVDREDLVQEVFTRTLELLLRGQGPTDEKFPSYLSAAIRNTALSRFRKRKHEVLDNEIELAALDADPAMLVVDRDAVTDDTLEIALALRSLDIRWQVILLLVDIKGLPIREAAECLSISPGAANSLLYRARCGLRGAALSTGAA